MAKRQFGLFGLLLLFVLLDVTQAQQVRAPSLRVEIESQPLNKALNAWAEQTGYQVLIQEESTRNGDTAPNVSGTYTPENALRALLVSTGLEYRFVNDRTVVIRAKVGAAPTTAPPTDSAAERANDQSLRLAKEQSTPSGTIGALPSYQAANAVSPNSDRQPTADAPSDAKQQNIDQVIVTAQKREERLQDVPVPVTVINAETLAASNKPRLSDYYTTIPGLSLTLLGNGDTPSLSIRGLTTGGNTNPTVGIVVDDVPYGASISPGTAPSAPDIDPADLARVEVLRGPQGTLYGADSIGGLLKFVTLDPSTEATTGRLQVGLSNVRYGDTGYEARGGFNLPLSDSVAVRGSGFKEIAPGYIDDIQTGQRDVNGRDDYGGRLAGLWTPSDVFSLKLSALYQHSERSGMDETDVRLAPQLAYEALANTGGYSRDTQVYGATIHARFAGVDLVSVTGYGVDTVDSNMDATQLDGGLFSTLADTYFGATGAVEPATTKTTKFTQEVRASTPITDKLQWMFGGFYTHESIVSTADFLAVDPLSSATAGDLLSLNIPSTFEEYAAFTDLTVQATDRFDVQFGGRWSENEQSFSTTRSGPLVPVFFSGVSVVPTVRSEDSPVTYLVTPRFKASPDLMVYARFASGYRPGGPNTSCGAAGVPQCQYNADTTLNYEVGAKGDAWDHVLTFDSSVYYIDWRDVQVLALTPTGLSYRSNAGEAKSQGVELSVDVRPYSGLSASAWVAYNDAEMTEVPASSTLALGAAAHDRLPYSSPISGNLSLRQEFPLGSSTTGAIGGSLSYVGDREGQFSQTGRATFPGYAQTDALASVQHDSWTINLFVNNATDKRGVLKSGALDSLLPFLVTYIEPRTAGISFVKLFQ